MQFTAMEDVEREQTGNVTASLLVVPVGCLDLLLFFAERGG